MKTNNSKCLEGNNKWFQKSLMENDQCLTLNKSVKSQSLPGQIGLGESYEIVRFL